MAQGMPCQIEGIVSILVTPHRTLCGAFGRSDSLYCALRGVP